MTITDVLCGDAGRLAYDPAKDCPEHHCSGQQVLENPPSVEAGAITGFGQ